MLRRDDGLIRGGEEFSRNKREQSLKLTGSAATSAGRERGKGVGSLAAAVSPPYFRI